MACEVTLPRKKELERSNAPMRTERLMNFRIPPSVNYRDPPPPLIREATHENYYRKPIFHSAELNGFEKRRKVGIGGSAIDSVRYCVMRYPVNSRIDKMSIRFYACFVLSTCELQYKRYAWLK